MYRYAIENLDRWKNSKNRKPLIIEGARQVGKTWLMKEFGEKSYKRTVYINFDSNVQMAKLFSADLNVERIIMGLELYDGHKITPADTLIIFDEVQGVPRALSSLKYFYENARNIILYVPVRFRGLHCTKEHLSRSERWIFLNCTLCHLKNFLWQSDLKDLQNFWIKKIMI